MLYTTELRAVDGKHINVLLVADCSREILVVTCRSDQKTSSGHVLGLR